MRRNGASTRRASAMSHRTCAFPARLWRIEGPSPEPVWFSHRSFLVRCCPSLPEDLVRVRTRPGPDGRCALAAAGPQECVTIIPKGWNISLAISFPNLHKPLPPTSSGSVRANTLQTLLFLEVTPNHSICRILITYFVPFWRFCQMYHTPGSS